MSCYNSAGTGAFTNSTLIPSLYPNGTQYYPFKYEQFLTSLNRNVPCGGPTYLRPDVGNALLPWLYAVIALIVHIPIVIIRVARWDKVQILSLALAALTVGVTLQCFKSSHLAPDQVFIWMPLALALDAGSMMQLAVLIVEDVGFPVLLKAMCQAFSSKSSNGSPSSQNYVPCHTSGFGKDQSISIQELRSEPILLEEGKVQPDRDVDNTAKAFIALGSAILFIIIVSLQIVGVVYAAKGRQAKNLTVSWCSPIFELFAIAISDGNCHMYTVLENSGKGIGCIELPAARQKDWLLTTLVVGSVALVFQFCDFLILLLVNTKTRWRHIKMKRPWLSMFSGLIILLLIACFSIFQSIQLPADITESVLVYRNDLSANTLAVCTGEIFPAGLRGSIIGWTDGVFKAWNTSYYGPTGS